MRQRDALNIYVVLYVCKGHAKLGHSFGVIAFLKWTIPPIPPFNVFTKTNNLFPFPQRQSLSVVLPNTFDIFSGYLYVTSL